MAITDCNADERANSLFTSLTTDSPTIPVIDLSSPEFSYSKDLTSDVYTDTIAVTLDQLTEVDLEGSGVFDKLMQAMDIHIQREFKNNRITGDQYAKVYTEISTSVLNQSVSFLLAKEESKWSSITAQMKARVAEIEATEALIKLEATKADAQKSVFDMQNAGAQYALTKMQIANADASYCLTSVQFDTAQFQLTEMLPVTLNKEKHLLTLQLPAQTNLLLEQRETQRAQTLDLRSDGVTTVSGLVGRQANLLQEQVESERAKTMDSRSDGSTIILGSIGKQKDLYTQQIDSFAKDSKQKAAKMYLDGWITQKTLDENLLAPTELSVDSVSNVLLAIRNNNGL
jgi:hypothetical protein